MESVERAECKTYSSKNDEIQRIMGNHLWSMFKNLQKKK